MSAIRDTSAWTKFAAEDLEEKLIVLRELIESGADAVAVISAVFGDDDPAAVTRAAAALAACFQRV